MDIRRRMVISLLWNYFSRSSATILEATWLFDVVQSSHISLTWVDSGVVFSAFNALYHDIIDQQIDLFLQWHVRGRSISHIEKWNC